MQLFYEAVLV